MPIIEWMDDFSVGINEFDNHHQYLIKLLNQTYDEFIAGADDNALMPILDELIKYTDYHFTAEEQWMEANNYPRLHKHRGEHEYFVGRVTALRREFGCGQTTMSLEILTFLKSWLSTHILGSDAEYGDFARDNT